jgi:hypothetical protein
MPIIEVLEDSVRVRKRASAWVWFLWIVAMFFCEVAVMGLSTAVLSFPKKIRSPILCESGLTTVAQPLTQCWTLSGVTPFAQGLAIRFQEG